MSILNLIQECGIFIRPKRGSDMSYALKSVNREDFFLGGEETYIMEWLEGDNHFQCIVHQQKEIIGRDRFGFYFTLDRKVVKFINELFDMCLHFTNESWKKALQNYPNIYYFAHYSYSHQSTPFSRPSCHYYDEAFFRSSDFKSGEGLHFAKTICAKLYGMLLELRDFRLDTTVLKKNKPIIDVSKIPGWVKYSIAVGGVVAIKLIINSVGHEIEIELPETNGDGNDIDIRDSDYSISINGDSDNCLNGSEISFQGKTKDSLPLNADSDGKIPAGNITLSTVGGNSDTFKLFKQGTKQFVLYYGNYIPLEGNSVTIGNIKYKL